MAAEFLTVQTVQCNEVPPWCADFNCVTFPYNCMSEREGCQVTIWPSDSQCHTDIPTFDTGCLYFLEIIDFI